MINKLLLTKIICSYLRPHELGLFCAKATNITFEKNECIFAHKQNINMKKEYQFYQTVTQFITKHITNFDVEISSDIAVIKARGVDFEMTIYHENVNRRHFKILYNKEVISENCDYSLMMSIALLSNEMDKYNGSAKSDVLPEQKKQLAEIMMNR